METNDEKKARVTFEQPEKPHCPKCGYTKEDQQIHGDHHLCDGKIPADEQPDKQCGICWGGGKIEIDDLGNEENCISCNGTGVIEPEAAGQEQESGAVDNANRILFSNLKYQIGNIFTEKFLEHNEGKFHTALELNPAIHAITEFVFDKIKQQKP